VKVFRSKVFVAQVADGRLHDQFTATTSKANAR
jgi:hypothetical protein